LDTSIIIPWTERKLRLSRDRLRRQRPRQGDDELDGLKARALQTGADRVVIEDLRDEFCSELSFSMIQAVPSTRGNTCWHQHRPSIDRQGDDAVVEQEGADAVAHGCTGKGTTRCASN
jgi:argininosuccinate synthase